MSWFSAARLRCAAAAAASFGLAGCFQPLYGGVAGAALVDDLAAIDVTPIPDRLGYYLTKNLTFAFQGGGGSTGHKYRLDVTLHERAQTPLVDTVSGRATAANVGIDAEYTLTSAETLAVVTSGTAFVTESYDRSSQRFANIRAARDAEIRGAETLSDQIRTRVAAALRAKD